VCDEVRAEAELHDAVGVELLQVDKLRVARTALTVQRSAGANIATAQSRTGSNGTSSSSSKAVANATVAKPQAASPSSALDVQAQVEGQASNIAAFAAKAASPSLVFEVHTRSETYIPSLGDIIQETKDAASSIAGEVADQVKEISHTAANAGVDSIQDLAGSASTAAALEVAGTLNRTLVTLDEKAVQWRASCYAVLGTVVDEMNVSFNSTLDEVRTYEARLQGAINRFMPYWGNISEGVRATTVVASGVLKTLGQDSYVLMLNESVTVAMGKAGEVAEALANTTKLLNGLGGLAQEAALADLQYVNTTLEFALDAIGDYAEQLEVAFEDLTDQAAAGLEGTVVGANASAVEAAFGSVRAEASKVVQDLFDGPAGFVTGLTEATTQLVTDLGGTARSGSVVAQRASAAAMLAACVSFLFGLQGAA